MTQFGGVIGWLALFGFEASQVGQVDAALGKTVENASKIALADFVDFLKIRPGKAEARYRIILSKVALDRSCRWSGLRRAVEEREGNKLADAVLANLLSNLVKASFLEESENKTYRITDPMLAKAMIMDQDSYFTKLGLSN